MGENITQYLLALRMDKARALLTHTDYPVSIIANMVGYQDTAAFSHRFSAYFGHSPRKSRQQVQMVV
ncbi:helix-turn-helix transcriptional regulator [Vibrio sp. DW001]|uniref:helix-turn-helix domain-containing protein n=1 Tax=Vibrio sp. DW001 TaxID=2912315 RepID=UPI0023B088D7|nr:helix-turn-helix transcriptional regulator [Vibrio sp. DW001]WED28381.1 helix-turn-helix transcriptional regulator [Vibrio sp. DW001]